MSESLDARRTHAVRALLGESVGLVTGMSFVPLPLLAAMEWGDESDPAELVSAAARRLDLDFAFVPSSAKWAADAVKSLAEGGTAALWVVDGAFSHAARVHGWPEAIRLSIADPAALQPALDEGTSAGLAAAARGFGAGACALVIADDLAGSAGPLLAPDFVHEELMPRLSSVVGLARRDGCPVLLHSDGDIRVFMPALARVGFAAVHGGGPGDESFVALLREARRFGMRTVGGIGSSALQSGPAVAESAGARAALLALPGDLLVSDDGGIATAGELEAFGRALGAACSTNG